MNPFDVIKEKLKKYPQLTVEETSNMLIVKATSKEGFDVSFSIDHDEYTVYFEGWHEHFEKSQVDEALSCFAFGLSDSCRIKQFSKNGKPYKWELEAKENGKWSSDSVTGLFTLNFWSKPTINYLQNKVLNA